MGVDYVEMTEAELREKLDDKWSRSKALTFILKEFTTTLKKKKNWADELDEETIVDVLTNQVETEMTEILSKVKQFPTSLKIFTDRAFLSTTSKLFCEYTLAGTKKKVTLDIDYEDAKKELKEENKVLKKIKGESEKQLEKDIQNRKKSLNGSWEVLSHPDLAPTLRDMVGDQVMDALGIRSFKVTIEITDDEILETLAKADEMGNVMQKVKDAADWEEVLNELADVLRETADEILNDPGKADNVKEIVTDAAVEVCQRATDRAIGAVKHFKKVRRDYKRYKVKSALKVGSSVVGLGLGLTAVGLGGLTFGASLIFGLVGVYRSAVTLADQISTLAQSAEGACVNVANQVNDIAKAYKNASSTTVGMGDVGLELLKQVIPTDLIPSIKSIKSNLDTFEQKTNGIEVRADNLSKKLSQALDKEQTLRTQLEIFLRENPDALTTGEAKRLEKLMELIPGIIQKNEDLIDKIIKLNKRVEKLREWYTAIADAFKEVSSKQPTWAMITANVIPLLTTVGLAVGGNLASPPDLSKAVEIAKLTIETTSSVMDATWNIYEGVSGIVESVKSRK